MTRWRANTNTSSVLRGNGARPNLRRKNGGHGVYGSSFTRPMNVDNYSKKKFDALGLNTPAARKLADELQREVNKVVLPAVEPVFLDVIKQLNAQGHNLQRSGDASLGKISFRDEPIKNQS